MWPEFVGIDLMSQLDACPRAARRTTSRGVNADRSVCHLPAGSAFEVLAFRYGGAQAEQVLAAARGDQQLLETGVSLDRIQLVGENLGKTAGLVLSWQAANPGGQVGEGTGDAAQLKTGVLQA